MTTVRRGVFLGMALAFPLLAAATPRIVSVEPAVIPYGQPHTLTVQVADWTPTARLALTPGGPSTSGTYATAEPAQALGMLGDQHRVVVTRARVDILERLKLRRLASFALRHGAPPHRTAAWGSTLLITDGHALLRLTSAGEAPVVIFSAKSPIRDVAIAEQRAFVLLKNRRLITLELAPQAPARVLASAQLSFDARRLRATPGRCYLVAPDAGVVILDCGSASASELGRFKTSGVAQDIAVENGVAYIADGAQGLTLLDVADPAQIRLLGSNNKLGTTRHIAVNDARVLISNQNLELHVLDALRRELPLVLSKFRLDQPIAALDFREDVAFAATAHGMQRIDFSGDAPPLLSDEGVNLGGSRRGFVKDEMLYVADWFSGLHLYDISNPARLRHLGHHHTPGSSKGVVVHGTTAFVGDDDHGIQIIDIKDPAHPVKISEVATPGLAYTMKRMGDYLYVADHRGGFHILDVSDVTQARIVGSYDTPGKAWAVDVAGDYAYVADDASGLLVFDVRDATRPQLIGQYTPGGQAEDVRLHGRYALVAFFDHGLAIVDVSDPRHPRPVAQLALPGNARGIDLQGDYAYIAAWEAGLQIVDISDPSQPRSVGYYDTDGSAWGVNVSGEHAYVLDWWGGVKAIDIRTPTAPRLADRYQAREPTRAIALAERYGYVAYGTSGVQVFDLSNALNPIWVTGVEIPGRTHSLAISGVRLYALSDAGLAVLDIQDPFQTRLHRFSARTDLRGPLHADEKQALILDTQGGLWSSDADGKLASVLPASRRIEDFWMTEDRLYCVTRDRRLLSFNRTTPKQALSSLALPQPAQLVRADQTTVVTATHRKGLRFFAHGKQGLREVSRYDLADKIEDLHIADHLLFVSTARSGLWVIDIHDPSAPMLKSIYPTASGIARFAVKGDQVFFAGENKLTSLKLLPDLDYTQGDERTFVLTLPSILPLGSYGLAVFDRGQSVQRNHNAFAVKIRTGKKPTLSPDRFQQLLEQQRLRPPLAD